MGQAEALDTCSYFVEQASDRAETSRSGLCWVTSKRREWTRASVADWAMLLDAASSEGNRRAGGVAAPWPGDELRLHAGSGGVRR
jgi:hypothetical protein